MEKTILIAGKDFPDGRDLSSSAILHGDTVVIAYGGETEQKSEDDAVPVRWNRGSALSARSLVISALNQTGHLDEAVLIFDESYYAPKFGNPGPAESNRAYDELILGYQFLTAELLLRFEQRKLSGLNKTPEKLIFVYKKNPSECDAVKNPSVRALTSSLSKSLVASAGAFFKAFAENTAASLAQTEDVIPVLVECAEDDELSKKDGTLMSWLCDYTAQIDELKKDLSAKQKVSWIKAGAKSPGGFALFK